MLPYLGVVFCLEDTLVAPRRRRVFVLYLPWCGGALLRHVSSTSPPSPPPTHPPIPNPQPLTPNPQSPTSNPQLSKRVFPAVYPRASILDFAQGGFDWACMHAMGSHMNRVGVLFGLQNIPWICRIDQYGWDRYHDMYIIAHTRRESVWVCPSLLLCACLPRKEKNTGKQRIKWK